MIDRFFGLAAHRTDVRTEVVAGITTFLAMAYIIFVQPAVLSAAGMDFGASWWRPAWRVRWPGC